LAFQALISLKQTHSNKKAHFMKNTLISIIRQVSKQLEFSKQQAASSKQQAASSKQQAASSNY
jgi:predicted nucleotide-binding protein (sugar kinase/HSP70/actin superfamily)